VKFSLNKDIVFLTFRYFRGRSPFLKLMSSLSIVGVGVGVATLIVVLSVMTGLRKQLKEKILGITPHILITKYGGVIEDWEKFVDELKKIEGVRVVFPLIVGNAILKKDELTTSVVLQCIPAKYVKDTLFFKKFLKYGEVFSDGKVNVGHQLAKNLNLDVGDKILIVSPYGDATIFGFVPNTTEVEISGIVEVGIFDWDSVFVFLDISQCQELFDTGSWVSSVAVMLDDPDKADFVSGIIEYTFPEFVALPWTRTQKNLFAALRLEKIGMTLVLGLIVVVASFNILSTLTILVRDKSKDIAVLKVFGFSSHQIRLIFLGVGVMIGLVGILLGTSLGLLISFVISRYKIIHLPEDVYFISHLPSELNFFDILLSWAVAFFSSLISGWFPVSYAIRKEPFDILRKEA